MENGRLRFPSTDRTRLEDSTILLGSKPPQKEKSKVKSVKERFVRANIRRDSLHRGAECFQTNRLLAVENSLSKRIPRKIRHRMANNIAVSSSKCYQRCWDCFLRFVKSRKKTTKKFSVVMVYRFFNYLILKNFKYQTLLVYRSAIKRPIRSIMPSYSIEKDENLKNLLVYAKTNSKKEDELKLWDLDKVLNYVKTISMVDLDMYFKKCFFLNLLASPRRINEFKSLVVSRIVHCSDGSLVLRPHSRFIKKNHTEKFCPQDVPIPSFPENPEICPVEHLENYLRLSSDLFLQSGKRRPDQLWIDTQGKPLNLSKMRSWFRQLVIAGDSEASVNNTKFHSIRAVAASALEYRNLSITEICKGMQWSNSSKYTDFYSKLQLTSLSPAVIAGFKV